MLFAPMLCGMRRVVGSLIVLGVCVGITASTCAYFIGWVIAQARRLIQSIR